MMQTYSAVGLSWDYLSPGMSRPLLATSMDCDFTWFTNLPSGVLFEVVCTRDADHQGRQHVAEDETHVIAVHPWV